MNTDSQSSHAPASPAPPLWRRVMGWPGTSPGRWSLGLVAGFAVSMGLFFAITSLYGGAEEVRRVSMLKGGRFFSMPWIASTLLAADAAAIAAGVAACVAIIGKGERSILMLVPLFVAAISLLFTIGELCGG
jgi:hypothetical protein